MRAHQETLEEPQRLGHTLEGSHQHLWTETGPLGTPVCSHLEALCDRKSTHRPGADSSGVETVVGKLTAESIQVSRV